MKKQWKKINLKQALFLLMTIIAVLFLKSRYIECLNEGNYMEYMKSILFVESNNFFISLFWLLPILISLYIITQTIYNRFIHFNMRYKDRNKYSKKNIYRLLFFGILFNSVLAFIQIILFMKDYDFILYDMLLSLIVKYCIGNVFLCTCVIFIALLIRNYIKSFVIVLTSFMILIKIPNFIHDFLPLININYDWGASFILLGGILLLLFLIYRFYLHYDMGGES